MHRLTGSSRGSIPRRTLQRQERDLVSTPAATKPAPTARITRSSNSNQPAARLPLSPNTIEIRAAMTHCSCQRRCGIARWLSNPNHHADGSAGAPVVVQHEVDIQIRRHLPVDQPHGLPLSPNTIAMTPARIISFHRALANALGSPQGACDIDGLWCDAEAEGDRRVGQAFGAGEHACPLDQGVGQGGRPGAAAPVPIMTRVCGPPH